MKYLSRLYDFFLRFAICKFSKICILNFKDNVKKDNIAYYRIKNG